jgi:hypothetical protein
MQSPEVRNMLESPSEERNIEEGVSHKRRGVRRS